MTASAIENKALSDFELPEMNCLQGRTIPLSGQNFLRKTEPTAQITSLHPALLAIFEQASKYKTSLKEQFSAIDSGSPAQGSHLMVLPHRV